MNWIDVEQSHTSGLVAKRSLCIVRGEGAALFDADGRSYVDCVGGQGVCTLGHANPVVAGAVAEQAKTLVSCPEMFYNDKRAEFVDGLSKILPAELNRYFLCNSGAEAVEASLKLARLSTGRTGVISMVRGFHGRTLGALSATFEPKYRKAFEPLFPDFRHWPLNKLEGLQVDENTSAIVIEPVQGEGGVHRADKDFLKTCRKRADEHGCLLIFDEIQTGFGRTGRWFAFEESGVVPDILVLGKAIAGGVPMGAIAFSARVQNIAPGLHGSTFGGNPLACAAGSASLKEMARLEIPTLARDKGAWLLRALQNIESPVIREVRGFGLILGIELKTKVAPYLRALEKHGVLALPAGLTVLRLLPPAVITQEQLQQVVDAIAKVLNEAPDV